MKHLRKILFPFAGLYYLITYLRNKGYDWKLFSSKEFQLPVICVGNLSTGGTGKTPMTEYLIRLLKDSYKVATLSRGYGRKTEGYLDVSANDLSKNVGDEPLQFAQKFDDIRVAVSEKRREGIEILLSSSPSPELIILDDAFQHRKVKAGFQILLTTFSDIYSSDFLLPVGNLRESRKGAHRAQSIIVTKCPIELSINDREKIKKDLKTLPNQSVYFTAIDYDTKLEGNKGSISFEELSKRKVTLVTGIANPKPLVSFIKKQDIVFTHDAYGDHHNFTANEIRKLDTCECIITTEKDYMRLAPVLKNASIYYLPIRVKFLDKGALFNEEIIHFAKGF